MKIRLGQSRILAPALGWLTASYLRAVHASARVVIEPDDTVGYLKSLAPGIIALWHGQFLMCPTVHVSRLPLNIVVAMHDDAEILARALSWFGMGLIRGAGAGNRKRDRGGARAFVEAAKRIKAGENVAMTADVPPGPARVAGTGIVMLAKTTGRPIVPLAVATTHARVFGNWSKFTLNYPFGTLAAVYGQPVWVSSDADDAAIEVARKQVQDELNRATVRAYEIAGARPPPLGA